MDKIIIFRRTDLIKLKYLLIIRLTNRKTDNECINKMSSFKVFCLKKYMYIYIVRYILIKFENNSINENVRNIF
jgi:hypothetical protein